MLIASAPSGRPRLGSWLRREAEVSFEQPVLDGAGEIVGWLAVAIGKATEPDVRLTEATVALVAAAIENSSLTQGISARDQQLRELAEQLRISEQAFDLTFGDAELAMAKISLAPADPGRVLQGNEALCRLTGYSAAELSTRTLAQLTHPDDQGLDQSALRRAMVGRRTPFRGQKRYLRADGGIVPVRVTVSPLFDGDDQPLYALALILQLTELEKPSWGDPLTGLPDEAKLREELTEALLRADRHGTSCAVLMTAVDDADLAGANLDEAGLAELQREVARRLGHTMRTGDVVSRIEENRFVIVTEEVRVDQADAVAARLEGALQAPGLLPAGAEASVSVGMVVSTGTEDTDTMLERARLMLAEAQQAGPGSRLLYQASEVAQAQAETLYAHPDWQRRR